MSDADPKLGALGVTRDQAVRLWRLLNRKFVFGGAIQGRVTEDAISLFVAPPPGAAPGGGGGATLLRVQVTTLYTGPFRFDAKQIKSDGTLDSTVLTVFCDTFASPTDWNNVTPALSIGTVAPVYQGRKATTGELVWWCAWPFVGLGPC